MPHLSASRPICSRCVLLTRNEMVESRLSRLLSGIPDSSSCRAVFCLVFIKKRDKSDTKGRLRCEPASGVPHCPILDNGKSAVYGMTARECNTSAYLVMKYRSRPHRMCIRCRINVHKCLSEFMAVYKRIGLAAKDVALSSVAFTGMMLHFCRHSCQILPATL